ncbi:hypothetical protein PFLUV_G00228140 [Perca fluviatilis]|uniref:HECT domain-containing protein n=1 Tax=Perca fluviatilis TaxID=8168 RepID=A0A6A5E6S0_PERFL|nr:hypothetical protein PFLUV_G00228140 [Perca fluviatilis]
MSKSCPELLREAANLIEEALSRSPTAPAAPVAPAAQSQQIPATQSRTPVQVIPCITCQKEVPFSEMKLHRLSCNGTPMQESEREQEGGQSEENDSETALVSDSVPVRPETSAESAVVPTVIVNEELDCTETDSECKLIKEPTQAAKVFKENLLREHATGKPLRMKMDVRDSEEDRERELLLFYKQQQEWACPLHCTLVGDVAIGEGVMRYFMTTIISKLQFGFSLDLGGMGRTLLFEGEPDHLVPAASEALIESNLFRVAGRMLAHTFLHDGPHVTGLSPAVIHVLFNGDPEMATVVTEDCPDLHIRSIIELVIGRTMRQIKQLRKGLKDVMVWPLLASRPDVVPLLFPKMAEMQFTPQMLLEKITWPVEDSDDEDFDLDTTCRITGFLRMFIETASSGTLAQLLTFWVGWEMLPPELRVEISGGTLPTSSTCFETLKLPAHFKIYMDFEKALVAAIKSTGFGLV